MVANTVYNKEIVLGTGLNNGYLYFLDKDHPLAYLPTGIVLLHRHNLSLKLGRWINSTEHCHHIDGNKHNNSLDNLQLVSKSEHAKIHADKRQSADILLTCLSCKKEISIPWWDSTQKYCSDPCRIHGLIKDKTITKEVLDKLIPLYSWTKLGEIFGYSDNGIKKRAKALGCDITKAKCRNKRQVEERNTL